MPSISKGATDVSLYVYFVDDDGGTAPGEPTTGLLFSNIETGGSASYVRQGAARTDFTLVTLASASAAHADGGFILVDDTNMPGLYRVDLPDAAFVDGVDLLVVQLVAAAANNTIMRPLGVELRPASFDVIVHGVAEAGTLSTTQMTSDLTEATVDHYKGRVVIWTTGALADQASKITGSGASGLLSFVQVTEAPSAGDKFVIV